MKKLLLCWAFLLAAITMGAVPAKPGLKKMLKLSDGITVEARLVGDEHGHFWMAKDGKTYKKAFGAHHFIEVNHEAVKMKADKRRAKANAKRAHRMKSKKKSPFGQYIGKKKGLIILVEYQDKYKFQPENNQELFNRIANEEGFREDEFVGSVYDYFLAQSEGLFELKFDVVGPFTLAHERAYYGGNADTDTGEDLRPAEMVAEACQLADNDVNFKDYDWDGDGEVDQVFVLYAGEGEANMGDDNSVWPHEWCLSEANYFGDGPGALTLDGVTIDTYACSNELQPKTIDYDYNVTEWKIDGIGTICHEFSHCLGYPDFYDTNYKAAGMGYWDLMDAGSYNGEGFCPAGFTSYERWVAGWKEPIELTEDTEVEAMKALQDGGDTYVIYNDGNRNEFFLLENRQWVYWDEEIPGEGLLILHVDYDEKVWLNNKVNDTEKHQRMTWIAADNVKRYESYEGQNFYDFDDMAFDTYPYKSNNSFSNTSKPAATVYNKNADGSKKLNKSVTDITQNSDGTISFRFEASTSSVTPVGESEYKRITSTDELKENVDYLIVYEESDTEGTAYAGIDSTKDIGTKTDISINGYTTDGAEAQPVKLKKASGDSWYILDGNNYLNYNGSSNKLYSSSTLGTRGFTWIISTSDITNVDYPNRKLQYNSNSNGLRFACYTGAQKDVVLYVKVDDTTSIDQISMKSAKNDDIFDLSGRKMNDKTALKKGIYIVGGKKIVVK